MEDFPLTDRERDAAVYDVKGNMVGTVAQIYAHVHSRDPLTPGDMDGSSGSESRRAPRAGS